MDSWPQEEKMGVTSRQLSTGPIKSYQTTVAGFALGHGCVSWVGLVGHLNVWCSKKSQPLLNER